jgi:hypothetical protein
LVPPLLLPFYGSFFFLFIRPILCFSFFIAFPFFVFGFFIALPFFTFVFVSFFRILWVSSLAYPSLFGTKRLGCCCFNDAMLLIAKHVCSPKHTWPADGKIDSESKCSPHSCSTMFFDVEINWNVNGREADALAGGP